MRARGSVTALVPLQSNIFIVRVQKYPPVLLCLVMLILPQLAGLFCLVFGVARYCKVLDVYSKGRSKSNADTAAEEAAQRLWR